MIAIIGTVGVPASYGGFETLVDNLLDHQPEHVQIVVYCSKKQYTKRPDKYKRATLKYVNLEPNGFQSIPYDIISILDAIKQGCKTILVLGVSGALVIPLAKYFFDVKFITNIDGLEWKRDKWSKPARRYLKWSERIAVEYSDIVVADNKAISDYVMKEYSVNCETIAYGGDNAIPDEKPELVDKEYAFSVCRIEPENNVHLILSAFEEIKLKVKFVGNWDSSPYGLALKKKYKNSQNIEIIDPIYDVGKLFKLRSECAMYIHGHSAGGTNPSLVEMMHIGRPILCYDGTH